MHYTSFEFENFKGIEKTLSSLGMTRNWKSSTPSASSKDRSRSRSEALLLRRLHFRTIPGIDPFLLPRRLRQRRQERNLASPSLGVIGHGYRPKMSRLVRLEASLISLRLLALRRELQRRPRDELDLEVSWSGASGWEFPSYRASGNSKWFGLQAIGCPTRGCSGDGGPPPLQAARR